MVWYKNVGLLMSIRLRRLFSLMYVSNYTIGVISIFLTDSIWLNHVWFGTRFNIHLMYDQYGESREDVMILRPRSVHGSEIYIIG